MKISTYIYIYRERERGRERESLLEPAQDAALRPPFFGGPWLAERRLLGGPGLVVNGIVRTMM